MADETVATDDFTGDEDPLATNWETVDWFTAPLKTGGYAKGRSNDNHLAFWDADTFEDDQYSQSYCSDATPTGSQVVGVAVRCRDATHDGYMATVCGWQNTGGVVQKWVQGENTELSYTGWTVGTAEKLFRIQVEGTTIKVFWDGTQYHGDITDSSLTEGYAGIYCSAAKTGFHNSWEGGNIVAAGGGHPTIKRWGGVPGMAINRGVW